MFVYVLNPLIADITGLASEFLLQGKMGIQSSVACQASYVGLTDEYLPPDVFSHSFCAGNIPTSPGINTCFVSPINPLTF